MADIEPCLKCGTLVTTGPGNPEPICDKCRGEPEGKRWEEMTIEEKVEHLYQLFTSLPAGNHDGRIGQES